MKRTNPLLLAGATVLLCACFVVIEIDKVVALTVSPSSKHHNPKHHQANSHRTDHDSNPITSRKMTTTAIFSATHSDGGSNPHFTHPKDEPGAAGTRNEERNTDHLSQPPEQEQYRPQALPLAPMELEEKLLVKHDALESFLSKSSGVIDGGSTITQPHEAQPHGLKSKNVATSSFASRSIPYFVRPVPYFLQYRVEEQEREISAKTDTTTDTILVENQRRASINRGVNDFNRNAIDLQYANNDTALVEDLRRASIDRVIYAFNKNLVDILYAAISYFYPTSSPSKQSDPRTTTTTPVGVISPLLGTEYNEASAPSQQDTKEHGRILRFEKFYVFETVARIPYFAYLSVLHLRETLGDKRSPFADRSKNNNNNNNESKLQNHHYYKRIEKMRTHYAQADNEVHHLLIMEALGGNARGIDRVLAHTMAFGYYWFVILVFSWNEQAAYHLNEVIEDHAYKVYEEFLTLYEDELRALPVPEIARKYYEVDYQNNPHLFETFCAVAKRQEGDSKSLSSRKDNRPHELHSLYDVFRNIRDDEKEHWMALCNLVQYDDTGGVDETNVQSTKKEGTADTIP